MKTFKLFFLILFCLVLLALGVYIYFKNNSSVSTLVVQTPKISPITEETGFQKSKVIVVDKNEFNYEWFKEGDPSKITLYLNSEKQESTNLMELKNCSKLTNAGFYSQDNSPLGLIVSQKNQLSALRKSDLFNGFFVVDSQNKAKISSDIPGTENRIVLQSGPLIIKETTPENLKIINDKQARRVVVGLDLAGNVYFIVVYSPQSLFLGPNLSDLPMVIKNISDKENLDVKNALNLDGGTASAFIDSDLKLTELTHIGSYFCVSD